MKFNPQTHIIGKVYYLTQENMNLMIKEIERLRKVIAKELSENDELGAEYTYVMALKEEIRELKKQAEEREKTNQTLTTELVGAYEKCGICPACGAEFFLESFEQCKSGLMEELKLTRQQNAQMKEALQRIAKPTYGAELHMDYQEISEIYWEHIKNFQYLARKALEGEK